jgi:hypothetical protein
MVFFFCAPSRFRVDKTTSEDDRHRPRVVYRSAQLRQGESMSPSLMGLTHLVWGMGLIFMCIYWGIYPR